MSRRRAALSVCSSSTGWVVYPCSEPLTNTKVLDANCANVNDSIGWYSSHVARNARTVTGSTSDDMRVNSAKFLTMPHAEPSGVSDGQMMPH